MNDEETQVVFSVVPDSTVPSDVIKGSLLQKWDIKFTIIILLSFGFHAAFLFYLNNIEIPKKKVVRLEKIPERFAKLIVDKPIKKKVKVASKQKTEKNNNTEEEKEINKTPEQKKKEKEKIIAAKVKKAKASVARRAVKAEKRVRSTGMLKMLAGVGNTARGPAVVDVLGEQGRIRGTSGDLDNALKGITGLTSGADIKDIPLVRSRDMTGSKNKENIDDLIDVLGNAGATRLAKKGAILYKKPDIVGEASSEAKRSNAVVNRIVKKNLKRIEFSYEKYLKRNPQLAGKITIRFVIEEDGRVSNVEVISSTMNSPDLEKEIIRKVKRWRFEALLVGSGSTTVTYPFVFQPG